MPSKPLTPTQRRLIRTAGTIATDPHAEGLAFFHTVLCQTCLPYRDPGDGVRIWERANGYAHLKVTAGEAMRAEPERFVSVGLPFGPKARLILAHLNAEALRTRSPEIEVEDSVSAFIRRLNLDQHGRNIASVRDQLTRLSAASVRLGMVRDGRAITMNAHIVNAFDLWSSDAEGQRTLWPSTVRLSLDYFDSLTKHAVPLDERALAALAHSAMALDVYAWLAQRLHRIDQNKPQAIAWTALHDQFGIGFGRIRDFRRKFHTALHQVHAVYPAARVGWDIDLQHGPRGLVLEHSPPPISKRPVSGWTT